MSAEALAKGLSTECIFRWRRNRPNPSPDADPAPNPDTDGDEADPEEDGAQPDINVKVGPKDESKSDDHKMIVLGVIAALMGGLALGGGHAFVNNLNQYRANHH
jgi:hypothetical protein